MTLVDYFPWCMKDAEELKVMMPISSPWYTHKLLFIKQREVRAIGREKRGGDEPERNSARASTSNTSTSTIH